MKALAPGFRSWRWLRAAATYDFFPSFSTRVRAWVYNPLGILMCAGVASLLCGFFLHAQGFILAGGVAAVAVLGVLWPVAALRGLSGSLGFDRPRAEEGDEVGVILTLRNRLPVAAWGLAVRGGFGGDPARAVAGITAAPARRVAVCRWLVVLTHRGVYPLAPPRLTSGFPFGLWDHARCLTVGERLVVWPRTYPVGPVPPVGGDRQVEGIVSRNKVGTNGDVVGVRPYRRGDSLRRIHWGQSAKHDRLVVCELQSNSRPLIQLVLDADPRAHSGSGADGSREWAVRVVASLAKGWLAAGARVGLAWGGFDLPPASGMAQTCAVLDALAGLPDVVDQPLTDVLACPVCRGFRDGLQVVVTTDRTQAGDGCGACAGESQRWVVLSADGFGAPASGGQPAGPSGAEAWLRIGSPAEAPALLRGGWREARHGS